MSQHLKFFNTKLTIISLSLIIIGCTIDNNTNFTSKFRSKTSTAGNSIETVIKEKVYIPRDPTGGHWTGSGKAMSLWRADDYSWYELEIKDGASPEGFQMFIHLEPLAKAENNMLGKGNFQDSLDHNRLSNIYFKIWDSSISNYAYYGSAEIQCAVTIKRLDSGVLSGSFKGKFVRYDNPDDFIEIADGKFDLVNGKW